MPGCDDRTLLRSSVIEGDSCSRGRPRGLLRQCLGRELSEMEKSALGASYSQNERKEANAKSSTLLGNDESAKKKRKKGFASAETRDVLERVRDREGKNGCAGKIEAREAIGSDNSFDDDFDEDDEDWMTMAGGGVTV